MTEIDMLAQFTMALAKCEWMSLYVQLPEAVQTECNNIQNYMEVDYFDGNYQQFITWWDKTVVPMVEILQKQYEGAAGV